jgi:drug/metabolite transporter (DMT)-like permease
MNHLKQKLAAILLGAALLTSPSANAQSTEEKFNDLFVTAGYCTAFGAAIGTAFLAWTDDPSENLKYVAMGASLGFLGGSILGSYIIFSPGLVQEEGPQGSTLLAEHIPENGIVVRPYWSQSEQRVTGVESGMTLLNW